ncbi:porin [Pedobacter sp. SYSU D00535]|uniref:porin n=1 Tax=Pedobacter sp. SYSU D00535 TaxID=2810308 RepID=UPI001A961316|nr:porin [Pedobacter sp. SYSU D00535]
MKKGFLGCSVFLFALAANAQIVVKEKVGKGIRIMAADSSFYTRINGRVQTLYSGTHSLANDQYSDNIQVRRARLKFEGFAFNPDFEYKIELALSNADIAGAAPQNSNTSNIVLDAVAKWNFSPGFSLWFGQTKLPGNRERVISSQRLQFVDRSLLNSRYNIDRDLGFQLHHQFKTGEAIFREVAAISMGEGRNITEDNRGGYDFTGRVEVLPFGDFEDEGDYFGADLAREKTPKLSIGATYDFNSRASRERGQLGEFLSAQRDLKTLFVDAMFKYRGLSAMAEYADKRTNGSPIVSLTNDGDVENSFFTGTGFNLQAGYLFKNNFELAARYSSIDPIDITENSTEKQYTLGVSKYLAGHTLKVQSDVSLLEEDDRSSEWMYRFQVEIGF